MKPIPEDLTPILLHALRFLSAEMKETNQAILCTLSEI